MARTDWAAVRDSSVLYNSLTDPHQKFWKAVKDTGFFLFVGWPLLLALAVVFKEGF